MGEKKVKGFQPPYEEPRDGFSSEEIAEGLDRPGREEIRDVTDEGSRRDPMGEKSEQKKSGAANQNG